MTAWCGILGCFGLDILANFQEARVVAAHMIGAMTCFTAGTIYFCLQVRWIPDKWIREINLEREFLLSAIVRITCFTQIYSGNLLLRNIA